MRWCASKARSPRRKPSTSSPSSEPATAESPASERPRASCLSLALNLISALTPSNSRHPRNRDIEFRCVYLLYYVVRCCTVYSHNPGPLRFPTDMQPEPEISFGGFHMF